MSAHPKPRAAESKGRGRPSDRGRFLRLDDMIASTGLSESTIRRRIKAGEMPPSVAIRSDEAMLAYDIEDSDAANGRVIFRTRGTDSLFRVTALQIGGER